MTFFDVQIRKRLWLTICVLDMQTSLAQASKPLIDVDEVRTALASVRHVNDSEFGPETIKDVPDREGLTDVTFALVKFHLQVMGRRPGDGRGPPSLGAGSQLKWESLQQHAQQFEKSVLQLLHFCDPEESPYAWFTWHSTQLYVAGARLAALRPLYRTKGGVQDMPPRMSDENELLHHTTRALEKMELMHRDPRTDDFRWMITIQWHILAIAIAECYICNDQDLVRRAWTSVESLYQRHESVMTRSTGGSLQGPLGKLMRRTREKLDVPQRSYSPHLTAQSQIVDHAAHSASSTGTGRDPSRYVGKTEEICILQAPLHPEETISVPTSAPTPDMDTWDQSWKLWEEFMCEVSFDEFSDPATSV